MTKIYTRRRRTKSVGQSKRQSNVNTNQNHKKDEDADAEYEANNGTNQKPTNNDSKVPIGVPLELCEECQNPKSHSKYRPLVHSNGAFLCDICYRTQFPATAMCDEDDNVNIIHKVGNHLRTQFENDDDGNDGYNSEEECCTCK